MPRLLRRFVKASIRDQLPRIENALGVKRHFHRAQHIDAERAFFGQHPGQVILTYTVMVADGSAVRDNRVGRRLLNHAPLRQFAFKRAREDVGEVEARAVRIGIDGSAAYTDAELTQPYCSDATCVDILAPKGQQLPITPRFKMNATARYDFLVDEFKSHIQAALVYNGSSWNDLRSIERGITGKDPAYTVVNLAAGAGRDNWMLELSIDNVFDERATLYRYSECTPDVCGPQTYILPNRPRTIGLTFDQKF